MAINKPSIEQCVAFIVTTASSKNGISLRQAMEFCQVGDMAAQRRITIAEETVTLHRAVRYADQSKSRLRWFTDQRQAQAFEAGELVIAEDDPDHATLQALPGGGIYRTTQPKALLNPVELVTQARAFSPRLGSMDFAQWPSRRGNRLHYRDGRVESLAQTGA